jgi:hypothetical protein
MRKSLSKSIAGNSARTVVGQEEDDAVGEFAFCGLDDHADGDGYVSYLNLDPGDPSSGWRDTLVGSTVDFPEVVVDKKSGFEAATLVSDEPISSTRDAVLAAEAAAAGFPIHRHTASEVGLRPDETGVAEPLLTLRRRRRRRSGPVRFRSRCRCWCHFRCRYAREHGARRYGWAELEDSRGRPCEGGQGQQLREPREHVAHVYHRRPPCPLPIGAIVHFASVAPGEWMSTSTSTYSFAKAARISGLRLIIPPTPPEPRPPSSP